MLKKLRNKYLIPLIIFLVVDFGIVINFKELINDASIYGVIGMFLILISSHFMIIYHAYLFYKRNK